MPNLPCSSVPPAAWLRARDGIIGAHEYRGGPGAFEDEIRNLPVSDAELLEEWHRQTADPAIRNAYATKISQTGWSWQVRFPVLEFVREDSPSFGPVLTGIRHELQGVSGVVEVEHEDREVFIVRGTPSGEDLVRAAGRAVDGLSDRLRDDYNGLGTRGPALRWEPPFDLEEIRRVLEQRGPSHYSLGEAPRAPQGRALTPEEAAAAMRMRSRGKRTPPS